MVATETDIMRIVADCAEACERCAVRASAVSPDRHLTIYCRDCAEKCRALLEAMNEQVRLYRERSLPLLRSCERCADRCDQNFIYDFCRDTARICRSCAEACRTMAA